MQTMKPTDKDHTQARCFQAIINFLENFTLCWIEIFAASGVCTIKTKVLGS
jgi:hypothetical protein